MPGKYDDISIKNRFHAQRLEDQPTRKQKQKPLRRAPEVLSFKGEKKSRK